MENIFNIIGTLGVPTLSGIIVVVAYVLTIKEIKSENRKNRMDILKLTITNHELPHYARISAYDEYKHLGGNSWIDVYMQQEGLLQPDGTKGHQQPSSVDSCR